MEFLKECWNNIVRFGKDAVNSQQGQAAINWAMAVPFWIWIAAAGALLVLTIMAIAMKKRVYVPLYGDKENFFHKVLKYDADIKYQLIAAGVIGFGIATVVCYFCQVHPYVIFGLGGAFLLMWVLFLLIKIQVKFNRIEYNPIELQEYKFMAKPKVIEWKDVKQVMTSGQGNDRILMFVGPMGKKIKVPFKMAGSYEFSEFCAKNLEGKQFEAVRVMQARQ